MSSAHPLLPFSLVLYAALKLKKAKPKTMLEFFVECLTQLVISSLKRARMNP